MTHDEKTRIDTDSHDGPNADEQLDQRIADYLQQLDNGTAPDRDEFVAAHPDFAEGLKDFFADLDHFSGEATIDQDEPDVEQNAGTEPVGCVRYFGEYELLHEIARGGMGVVYEARQKTLKRMVAVKMILAGALASEEDVKRFRTEAQAAAGLQHPGIVSIHEVGTCEGQHYFSMDLVDGCSLADLVRDKALPDEQAARYVKLVAQAVQFAHGQGTLHRDLKPSNILIDRTSDEPRITDFGLAKHLGDDSGLTATGVRLGTPSYMSPEQASGETDQVGPASDIYSLGVILYELLTGHPPFRGSTVMQTLTMAMDCEPVPPRQQNPAIPRGLETVCLKCLQKNPADRYPSAGELAADLGRFLNGEPVRARRAGIIERSRRWLWKHRRMAVAALAVAGTALLVDFGRRKLDEYHESQKASLLFKTEGAPLVARIVDSDSNAVITEFTSPTALPVRLAAGDYSVRMSAPGHLSEVHRLLVQPRQERRLWLHMQDRSLAEPIRLEGYLQVVPLNGQPTVLELRESGVKCLDVMTGKPMWEFRAEGNEILSSAGIHWVNFSGVHLEHAYVCRPQPTPDLNGDGIDDLLWAGRDPSGVVAMSGADGTLVWAHTSKSESPNPWQKFVKSELLVGQPVAITEHPDPDRPPDFLLTFQRMASRGGLQMGDATVLIEPERWVERIDGTTGERRWRYTIDPQSYTTSNHDATPLPAFVMDIRGDASVIVPSGTSLIRLNLAHGSEPQILTSFKWPLADVVRLDVDADGQQELLVQSRIGRNRSKLQAIDVVEGNVIWGRETHRLDRRSWHTIASTKDAPAAIAFVTGSISDLGEPSGTTLIVQLLNANTGHRMWFDEQPVAIPDRVDALQLVEAPDIDGDGQRDLLVAVDYSGLRIAVNAHAIATGKPLWRWTKEITPDSWMNDASQLKDIQEWTEGPDGLPRLLISCGRSRQGKGSSHVLSASTGQRIAELSAIEEPQIADLNADGRNDLIWRAPSPDPGRQRRGTLHTISGEDTVAWRRLGEWHPAVDFDGDGVTDLTVTTFPGTDFSGRPRSVAISGRDGRVLWQAPAESTMRLPLPLPHGDVDGDGGADLFELGSRTSGNGLIYRSAVISGKTGKTLWETTSDCDPNRPAWAVDGFGFSSLLFGQCLDANQDGRPEIVLGYAMGDDQGISVIDGQTGTLLWNTNAGKNDHSRTWLEPLHASADGGEMIVLRKANTDRAMQYDAWNITTGEKLWTRTTVPIGMWTGGVRLPTCAIDLNGDSIRELVFAGSSLDAVDTKTGDTLWTAGRLALPSRNRARKNALIADIPKGWTANHPTAARLESDSNPFVCACSMNQVKVFDATGSSQTSVTLPGPSHSFWMHRWTLQAIDLDGNGDDELLLARQIHLTVPVPDLDQEITIVTAIDPLEEDPVLWSRRSNFGELLTTHINEGHAAQVVVCEGRTVYGLDGMTGAVRWSCNGPQWWFSRAFDPYTYFENRPTLLNRTASGQPRILFRQLRFGGTNPGVECRIGNAE